MLFSAQAERKVLAEEEEEGSPHGLPALPIRLQDQEKLKVLPSHTKKQGPRGMKWGGLGGRRPGGLGGTSQHFSGSFFGDKTRS